MRDYSKGQIGNIAQNARYYKNQQRTTATSDVNKDSTVKAEDNNADFNKKIQKA